MEGFRQRAEKAAQDVLDADRCASLRGGAARHPLPQIVALAVSDADKFSPTTSSPETRLDCLTNREREIAALVAAGLSNRQIAERLVISKRTVDAHLAHILAKLGVPSRVHIANWVGSTPD